MIRESGRQDSKGRTGRGLEMRNFAECQYANLFEKERGGSLEIRVRIEEKVIVATSKIQVL